MQNEVNQTRFFPRSPHDVWEYLTKPELVELWLAKTDIQPITGHKFHFADKWGKLIHCEVLEVRPFTRLSYSWQTHSMKDKKGFNSKVVWTLIPKEGGTELQLVHSGFAALEDQAAHNNGWNNCLQRMEERLKEADKVG